jgi:hypothetical protein
VKGKIVETEFEEGKEKEPQNAAVMEKFKDSDINAMSIIVDSIKDHLIPYISHLDSFKKMYDALTNLFSVRNIGQVMSLKNELRDMKMNDDDNITSYFVRISQLRDQLEAIEEIISEKTQKKYDDQAFTTRFKYFRNKRKFISRKKPNQEKDMLEIQCFNC